MASEKEINSYTLPFQLTPTLHRKMYPAISPTNHSNSAAGKKVLVTGATRGIGKVLAPLLYKVSTIRIPGNCSDLGAEAGVASIVITRRNKDLPDKVTSEIKYISPNTRVVAIPAGAGSESDTKALWAQVKEEVGIIDVLKCNADVSSEAPLSWPTTGKMNPSVWWSDMVGFSQITDASGTHTKF